LASRTLQREYRNMVDQMLLNDQVVAKYNREQNEVEIFNVEDTSSQNSDMVCLANMLNELVDEMIRRGYDPETIVFSMDKPWSASTATQH
jgi:hypothetical protein